MSLGTGISIVAPIVGLIGVVIGATVQYYLTKRAELTRNYEKLRTDAYVDFIGAVADLAIVRKSNADNDKIVEAERRFLDSKVRIVIYGSKNVVSVIARFFREYGQLTSGDALSANYAILTAMRSETPGGEDAISEADIGELLGRL